MEVGPVLRVEVGEATLAGIIRVVGCIHHAAVADIAVAAQQEVDTGSVAKAAVVGASSVVVAGVGHAFARAAKACVVEGAGVAVVTFGGVRDCGITELREKRLA